MNKVGFVMSSILTIVGLLLVAWAQVIRILLPYSVGEYAANLTVLYIIAVISIIAGVFLSVVFYKKGLQKD